MHSIEMFAQAFAVRLWEIDGKLFYLLVYYPFSFWSSAYGTFGGLTEYPIISFLG